MVSLIIKRFFSMLPVLLIISLITFLMMRAAPGGPWDRDAEAKQVPASIEKLLDHEFGLTKPAWRQYVAYVLGDFEDDGSFKCGAICGNLGPSYRQRGRMVQDMLFESRSENDPSFWQSRFGFSIRLGVLALLFAVLLGVPAGVIAALRQNSAFDYLITFVTNIGVSVPSFVLAIFLIVIFATQLHWTSVIQKSWGNMSAWIMPAAVLGFGTLASIARLTRTSVLEVMRLDFVRTARAKGLLERGVIWKHMLRNALIPVITILGPALAGLVTGSIVIEQIFGIPGVGRDFITSIGNRDYSMIMGTTLLYAVLIVLANLTVDLLYGVVDPRIRVN